MPSYPGMAHPARIQRYHIQSKKGVSLSVHHEIIPIETMHPALGSERERPRDRGVSLEPHDLSWLLDQA